MDEEVTKLETIVAGEDSLTDLEVTADDVLYAIVTEAERDPKAFDYEHLKIILDSMGCVGLLESARQLQSAESLPMTDDEEAEVTKLISSL